MRTIRIVAADDSAVMRQFLTQMFALEVLRAPAHLELSATVPDGASCLHAVRTLQPDVVLLDIYMPGLGGLETIVRLRQEWPLLPIIMCSAATEDGAAATLEALACGASDYVTKPQSLSDPEHAMPWLFAQLAPRIMALAIPATGLTMRGTRYSDTHPSPRHKVEAIGVGVSTGGPAALERLLPHFPEDFALPILIVQHMPKLFTSALATRLDHCCAMRVKQATAGAALHPGTIWIAPGDSHMEVKMGTHGMPFLALHQGERLHGCRPAVDVLFKSLANVFGPGSMGVVLTGMGADGLEGSAAIADAGGVVMAQDAASSAVWGMPGRVVAAGLAEVVLPLEGLAAEILELTGFNEPGSALPLRAAMVRKEFRYGTH